MYVDLHALPELKDAKARAAAEKKREQLNSLSQIDYEQVNDFKIKLLAPDIRTGRQKG